MYLSQNFEFVQSFKDIVSKLLLPPCILRIHKEPVAFPSGWSGQWPEKTQFFYLEQFFSSDCFWRGAANFALMIQWKQLRRKLTKTIFILWRKCVVTSSAELTLRIGRIGPKSSSWQVLFLDQQRQVQLRDKNDGCHLHQRILPSHSSHNCWLHEPLNVF